MEIKIRPLIKVLNKIIKIPKGNYLDPTTLGSGVPDSSKFLAGDSSWVSSPVPTPLGYYGAFQDNSTQTLPAINTPTAMRLDTVDLSNQVTVENDLSGDPTRITVAHTGIYNIQWSGEFMNVTNAIHDVNVWIRINGTDVTGSNGIVAVPARKSASLGDEGQSIQGWNYLLSLNGGDYVEFLWMSEDLGVTLHYFAGGYPPPSTASLIVTVTQQSGIMAGTGMTALNGLSSDVQLLSVGTSGTDFNIDSTTDTHTFNLPTASATNRGALKKADWSMFNAKMDVPTTFKWTLDLNAVLTGDIYPNQSCTIASVTNIVGSPTTTIQKNGAAYTFGGAIVSGDKITVTVSVASVIDLNFTI